MATAVRGSDGLRAAERTIAVLHSLADTPRGASLTELVHVTGIPASTLHRLLGLLRRAELVRETADGRYALAAGTMALARSYLDGVDLREQALAVLPPLAAATGETCHLGVLSLCNIVYLDKADSSSPVRIYSRVGQTKPALTTALGRAILAWSPPHVVDEVIEAHTRLSGQPCARATVDAIFATVRADGYARDLQENEADICCVAAPVFDHAGFVVAGMSISVPTTRFDTKAPARLGPLVRASADDLSHMLGWRGTPDTGYRSDHPVRPRVSVDAP